MEIEGKCSFQQSVYTEFFDLLMIDSRNIEVKCKLCPPTKKRTLVLYLVAVAAGQLFFTFNDLEPVGMSTQMDLYLDLFERNIFSQTIP